MSTKWLFCAINQYADLFRMWVFSKNNGMFQSHLSCPEEHQRQCRVSLLASHCPRESSYLTSVWCDLVLEPQGKGRDL